MRYDLLGQVVSSFNNLTSDFFDLALSKLKPYGRGMFVAV